MHVFQNTIRSEEFGLLGTFTNHNVAERVLQRYMNPTFQWPFPELPTDVREELKMGELISDMQSRGFEV